jgi:retron-type reverse transcriptase
MEAGIEMKRVGGLLKEASDFGHLHAAFQRALRGSGRTEEACRFHFHLERELLNLREELLSGSYRPGRYRYFRILEPKQRTISVAPFRDRVVHHAVVGALEPVFEPRFIFDSYATRRGKGTHRAVRRAQFFMRSHRWYLKTDVLGYFDHIDHDILLDLVGRKVKDQRFLDLIHLILANSDVSRGMSDRRGLPVGNLTSQFFANVYLDPLDHFVKETLAVRGYLRYMDDAVFFCADKEVLKEIHKRVAAFLHEHLRLTLNSRATFINSRSNGLPFLGFRIFPSMIRFRQEYLRRFKAGLRRRAGERREGRIDEETCRRSMTSIVGHAAFADTYMLRRAVTGEIDQPQAGLTLH